MPLDALALALAAAFLHAFWNLLIARAKNPEAATALALLVALVAYAPIAALTWRIEPAAIPYIVVTSFLQLGYVILLAAAYVRAELSVVYPIARGTAPVLVLVVGVAALGLGTSPQQAAGVCLVGLELRSGRLVGGPESRERLLGRQCGRRGGRTGRRGDRRR